MALSMEACPGNGVTEEIDNAVKSWKNHYAVYLKHLTITPHLSKARKQTEAARGSSYAMPAPGLKPWVQALLDCFIACKYILFKMIIVNFSYFKVSSICNQGADYWKEFYSVGGSSFNPFFEYNLGLERIEYCGRKFQAKDCQTQKPGGRNEQIWTLIF